MSDNTKVCCETGGLYFRNNISMYVVFTLLSLFSTVNPIFAIINFIFCVYIALTYSMQIVVPFFVYATFFATLCKILALTEMSLFTVVMLIYVIRLLMERKCIERNYFIKFALLVVILVIIQLFSGSLEIAKNIKFFENYLYLYFVILSIDFSLDEEESFQMVTSIFLAFVAGVIASSFTRLLNGSFFQISKFASQISTDLNLGVTEFVRFSGLYGDPNYYAVNVIIAMSVLMILFYLKQIRTVPFVALEILLVVFAVMTRSKSALLMLIVPLMFLLYINHRERRTFFQIVTIVAIVLIIALAFSGKIDWFSSITGRFKQDTNLNELTTGRVYLWTSYINYLKNNPIQCLFGTGLSGSILPIGGAHNTYIDILYFLGIIPGILYIQTIFHLFKMKKIAFRRNILNYSIIIVVSTMYFFLSCLYDIDLCTNLMLMIIVYNIPLEYSN